MAATFTEEQLTTARNLRDSGADWELVGLKMSVSGYAVRCALDAQFKQKQLEYNKNRMRDYRKSVREGTRAREQIDRHHIPREVLAEREKRLSAPNHSAFGDPAIGYSALDKLNIKRNPKDAGNIRISVL